MSFFLSLPRDPDHAFLEAINHSMTCAAHITLHRAPDLHYCLASTRVLGLSQAHVSGIKGGSLSSYFLYNGNLTIGFKITFLIPTRLLHLSVPTLLISWDQNMQYSVGVKLTPGRVFYSTSETQGVQESPRSDSHCVSLRACSRGMLAVTPWCLQTPLHKSTPVPMPFLRSTIYNRLY